MVGPRPKGTWTGSSRANCSREHQFLHTGFRYRVIRAFTDFDGDEHRSGETWVFLGAAFMPHDDGLSLFVSLDEENEWHVRMQWIPEQQGAILDALGDYITQSALG